MADPQLGGGPTLRGAAARGARFAVLCIAATVVLLILVWIFGGFAGLGLDTSGAIALSLEHDPIRSDHALSPRGA